MSAANSHAHAVTAASLSTDESPLFKEDRPRRIDRVISFFGDSQDDDRGGFGDSWSER